MYLMADKKLFVIFKYNHSKTIDLFTPSNELSGDVPVSQPMPKVGGRPTPHFCGLEGFFTLL